MILSIKYGLTIFFWFFIRCLETVLESLLNPNCALHDPFGVQRFQQDFIYRRSSKPRPLIKGEIVSILHRNPYWYLNMSFVTKVIDFVYRLPTTLLALLLLSRSYVTKGNTSFFC